MRPGRLRNRNRELRLAAPRRSFEQQRLLQLRGQEDNLGHHGVNEVARCRDLAGKFLKRIEHPQSSPTVN
jgi:hypothetical protein